MRVFVSSKTNMLKSILPHEGNKITLKCAMLATGNTNLPHFIEYEDKGDWKKDIVQFLSKQFKKYL